MEINIENLNWFKKCDLCASPIIKAESTAYHDMYGINILYTYVCGTTKHIKELAEGASQHKPIVSTHQGEKCINEGIKKC